MYHVIIETKRRSIVDLSDTRMRELGFGSDFPDLESAVYWSVAKTQWLVSRGYTVTGTRVIDRNAPQEG